MDIKSFHELECIKCLSDFSNPKVGDKFLTGNSMINQAEKKSIGDQISWYEVIGINDNGNVQYAPRYGVMKKQKREE